ncbi:MAG: Rrf2 family transcriptional regulator [Hyphomicrobiaceae bacterium]
MRLNKSTGHAIRILIECARSKGELVKVADLAASLDLTMQNVFKIVHILSRNRLISAARGRNGGVGLARPADAIRMGDIVRAMEATDIELDIEMPRKNSARSTVNGVNRVLDDALEAFISVLDQHTLAEMAGVPAKKADKRAPRRATARKSPQPRRARVNSSSRSAQR